MRMMKICGAVLFAMTIIACGGEEPAEVTADNVDEAISREVEKQTGRTASTDSTPCEILDDALIRAHFDVAEGVEISRSLSKYSPHPLCTVSWPKPDAEELQKEQAARMSEYMQAKMRGEDVKMPSFQTSNEVTLTLYEPVFDDAAKARSAFDGAMKRLSEGITSSREDVEITFQADLTPVEGVGEKAMWAPKLRQLSVVDGNRMYHVGVDTGSDLEAEMEKAKEIAQAVSQEL